MLWLFLTPPPLPAMLPRPSGERGTRGARREGVGARGRGGDVAGGALWRGAARGNVVTYRDTMRRPNVAERLGYFKGLAGVKSWYLCERQIWNSNVRVQM